MAGPLNGISGQQQYPVSNALQPSAQTENNTTPVREQREETGVRDVGAQQQNTVKAVQPQESATVDQDILKSRISEALSAAESGDSSATERGSLIDITV